MYLCNLLNNIKIDSLLGRYKHRFSRYLLGLVDYNLHVIQVHAFINRYFLPTINLSIYVNMVINLKVI
jgi:hypothetical protein